MLSQIKCGTLRVANSACHFLSKQWYQQGRIAKTDAVRSVACEYNVPGQLAIYRE